jgi:hypothetical protein
MKIELLLKDQGQMIQLTNILGISQELMVFSDKDGVISFAETKHLRIRGMEDDGEAIFQLLEMNDITVMVDDIPIFSSSTRGWRADMVDRIANEIIPLDE